MKFICLIASVAAYPLARPINDLMQDRGLVQLESSFINGNYDNEEDNIALSLAQNQVAAESKMYKVNRKMNVENREFVKDLGELHQVSEEASKFQDEAEKQHKLAQEWNAARAQEIAEEQKIEGRFY